MKRLLYFLLFFGAGLAVLLYFVNQRPPPNERPRPEVPPAPESFTEIPAPRADATKDGAQSKDTTAIGIVLDGRQEFTVFSEAQEGAGRPLYHVIAQDVDALGRDEYDAHDLELEILNPQTRAVRFRLQSPLTRLHIPLRAGKFTLGDGEKVELTDVDMTMFEGAPIVPLRLKVPRLEWRLREGQLVERFLSKDHVTLDAEGRGFAASGTGLDASAGDDSFELTRSGQVRLRLENGIEAVLSATGNGPMRVTRTIVGTETALDVKVLDGARLEIKGKEPLVLDSRELHVISRGGSKGAGGANAAEHFRVERAEARGDVVATSRGDSFRSHNADFDFRADNTLETAHLDGAVVLNAGDDVFRGDHAEFAFGAKGELERSVLTGSPSGDVELGKYLPRDLEARNLPADVRRAVAHLSGAGPLVIVPPPKEVSAGEQRELQIDLGGPGRVDVPELGFTMSAESSLVGRVDAQQKRGSLALRRAARVSYEQAGATLRDPAKRDEFGAETIDVTYALVDATKPGGEKGAIAVDTQGATWAEQHELPLATAENPKPEPKLLLRLDALGGLQARSQDGRLSVPLARDVRIKATGDRGLEASAAEVRDLDWDSRSLTAEGSVQFSNALGDGSAQTAQLFGDDTIELRGTPQEPAQWTLARRPSARGPLEARASAQVIRATRERLDARGAVVADIAAGGEAQHLECENIELELDPPKDPAKPDERDYRAFANGGVRATFRGPDRNGSLRCDDLRVDSQVRAAGAGAPLEVFGSSDVVATGAVDVDWHGKVRVRGRGDRFSYDRAGRGELASSGPRRVRAWGRLGRAGLPYAVHARRMNFDETKLEADDVTFGFDEATERSIGVLSKIAALVPGLTPREAPELADLSFQLAWTAFEPLRAITGPNLPAFVHELARRRTADAPADPLRRARVDASGRELPPGILQARTKRLVADEGRVLLEGEAHANGISGQGEWSVDAGGIEILGEFSRETPPSRDSIHEVRATGGFVAILGDRASARGETLFGTQAKTRIEGAPAQLTLPGARLESAWIQYDAENLLLSSDKGVLEPTLAEGETPWKITYESLQPFARGENTILVLRNPLFSQDVTQLRAAWALFWVDRDEWRRRGQAAMRDSANERELHVSRPEPQRPANARRSKKKTPADKFKELRANPITQILSELYISGDAELTKAGDRLLRAAEIYVDLKEGRGWLRDVDAVGDVRMRGFPQQFRAKAQWMSIDPDLTLRADKAVVTSCDYDDPHYVIESNDLEVSYGGERNFAVSAKENSLRFGGAWAMPLPPLEAGKQDGYPFIGDLNFGDSARFGASVRAAFNLELGSIGRTIGGLFGRFLDLPTFRGPDLPDYEPPEGRWKLNVGYLGSRGITLGTGLEFRYFDPKDSEREILHFDSSIDGVPDPGRDRGLVRVDPDDRPLLRDWFRVRARYAPGRERWWDLALSLQSDPGVQSEFFERDYLEYEQKDNYLHYRTSDHDWYFYGSAKVRLEDRTDIEELPSLGIAHGRSPIAHVGKTPIYYLSNTSAAYLIREEGDPTYYSPFPDGLGDREVLRADSWHRFEMPFDLDVAALRLTPFADGRVTAWDRGVDDAQGNPFRAGLSVGAELSTTFWRHFENGSLHALAPTLSVHGDVGVEEHGGDPVRFDQVEDPIEGRFIDLSLRSRVWKPKSRERFDVELTSSYGTDLPDGQRTGLRPIAVLSEFLTFFGDMPVGITHDGRYDVRDGDTVYSRTFLGFEPVHDLGVEFGYHLGRDDSALVLYEAATAAMRYRATQKWELELEQSYSLADSRGLGNTFTLRRIGHDFVMETEIGYRAGEGASFNISLKPLFAWKRSGLGLIDRWLGVYH